MHLVEWQIEQDDRGLGPALGQHLGVEAGALVDAELTAREAEVEPALGLVIAAVVVAAASRAVGTVVGIVVVVAVGGGARRRRIGVGLTDHRVGGGATGEAEGRRGHEREVPVANVDGSQAHDGQRSDIGSPTPRASRYCCTQRTR
jgi:hypothetical protein